MEENETPDPSQQVQTPQPQGDDKKASYVLDGDANKAHNVFEAIMVGDQKSFEPQADGDFKSTKDVPGSKAKLEVMRRRVLNGQPLWHPDDREDYEGLE